MKNYIDVDIYQWISNKLIISKHSILMHSTGIPPINYTQILAFLCMYQSKIVGYTWVQVSVDLSWCISGNGNMERWQYVYLEGTFTMNFDMM